MLNYQRVAIERGPHIVAIKYPKNISDCPWNLHESNEPPTLCGGAEFTVPLPDLYQVIRRHLENSRRIDVGDNKHVGIEARTIYKVGPRITSRNAILVGL